MLNQIDAFRKQQQLLQIYRDESQLERDYIQACSTGIWMFFIGFQEYTNAEDDEQKSHFNVIHYLANLSNE